MKKNIPFFVLVFLVLASCQEEELDGHLRGLESLSVEPLQGQISPDHVTIDFESFSAGDIVSKLEPEGCAAISVFGTSNRSEFDGQNVAMVFDSNNPTGNDPDLGTPNEDFGGPGIGEGGEEGAPFENNVMLNNVLILSEDLNEENPDDDANGGRLELDFSSKVVVFSIDILDIEESETNPDPSVGNAFVELLDENDNILELIPLPAIGDNGYERIFFDGAPAANKLVVVFQGSGAIDNIKFACPPTDCDECDGKVTDLTLQYNGDEAAEVKVVQKKDEVAVFSGMVNPGETFSFTGEDKNGTLGTEIIIYVDGRENTKIHTSCSKPIGPGLVSGDFEVILGSSLKGGPLCPIEIDPEDCCDGKVTDLTLQYNGDETAEVKVVQKKDEVAVFSGMVNPGETFSFTGEDKNGTLGTEIIIYVDGQENTKIHTSCSKPIGPGLVSGDFEVIEGTSLKGGALCPVEDEPDDDKDDDKDCCDGKVTDLTLQYTGATGAMVKVVQKKDEVAVFSGMVNPGETFSFTGEDKNGTLGTEIIIYVDGRENTKIHTSCSKPIGPGLVSGDFEVIEGTSLKGGALCPVEDEPDDDKDDDKDCCDGKVTDLTLQYTGATGAMVKVVQKKDEVAVFSGMVNPGETFSFTGEDKNGTLGTEIIIYVDGRENTKIHTSCSKPIGPGLVSGDFEVIEGTSLKGGALCPVEDEPDDDKDDDKDCCEGKVTDLTLRYTGASGAMVKVVQKKDDVTVFSGMVEPGDQFSFTGEDKNGTLGTEIIIYVDGRENTKIHTSCSKPIGPGLVSGDFEVIEGTSLKSGALCPV